MNLDQTLAERLVRIPLNHVEREFPHIYQHVSTGPESFARPSELHPIFYGSFDWHSCVHSWWTMLRLVRIFPGMLGSDEIRSKADRLFTPENVAGEIAYFQRQPSFERPYGWAWLLALHGEASHHDSPWAKALEPFAALLGSRFESYLDRLTYPVRGGLHSNTAFALVLTHEWASVHRPLLAAQIEEWTRDRFGEDRAAPWQEPSGSDFLSPTLVEAVLTARVLDDADFRIWFAHYLPELPVNLLHPATVSDRTDGQIGHLDGLNLSRAWCWRSLAPRLEAREGHQAREAASRLAGASLPYLSGDYMGEHWLATYAVLALSG
ncbi:DUF2891 domain-containing protein [bacterium]|nr:MAG: DUF2891 domain-containing protein [bacterium]